MPAKKDQQRPKTVIKTTHSLALPFTEPSWPQIQLEHQHVILDMLCRLLVDLGQYHHSLPKSSGKREKRDKARGGTDLNEDSGTLPLPKIRSHLLIGFNEVQRHLQAMINNKACGKADLATASPTLPEEKTVNDTVDRLKSQSTDDNLVALFVDRSSQPLIMTQHLPNMMATAASKESSLWLATLPGGAGVRLSETAAIPRFGLCGLLANAPDSISLLHYIKEHVQPVQPLIREDSRLVTFLPLKVETYSVEVESKLSGAKGRQQRNLDMADSGGLEQRRSKKRHKRLSLISQKP